MKVRTLLLVFLVLVKKNKTTTTTCINKPLLLKGYVKHTKIELLKTKFVEVTTNCMDENQNELPCIVSFDKNTIHINPSKFKLKKHIYKKLVIKQVKPLPNYLKTDQKIITIACLGRKNDSKLMFKFYKPPLTYIELHTIKKSYTPFEQINIVPVINETKNVSLKFKLKFANNKYTVHIPAGKKKGSALKIDPKSKSAWESGYKSSFSIDSQSLNEIEKRDKTLKPHLKKAYETEIQKPKLCYLVLKKADSNTLKKLEIPCVKKLKFYVTGSTLSTSCTLSLKSTLSCLAPSYKERLLSSEGKFEIKPKTKSFNIELISSGACEVPSEGKLLLKVVNNKELFQTTTLSVEIRIQKIVSIETKLKITKLDESKYKGEVHLSRAYFSNIDSLLTKEKVKIKVKPDNEAVELGGNSFQLEKEKFKRSLKGKTKKFDVLLRKPGLKEFTLTTVVEPKFKLVKLSKIKVELDTNELVLKCPSKVLMKKPFCCKLQTVFFTQVAEVSLLFDATEFVLTKKKVVLQPVGRAREASFEVVSLKVGKAKLKAKLGVLETETEIETVGEAIVVSVLTALPTRLEYGTVSQPIVLQKTKTFSEIPIRLVLANEDPDCYAEPEEPLFETDEVVVKLVTSGACLHSSTDFCASKQVEFRFEVDWDFVSGNLFVENESEKDPPEWLPDIILPESFVVDLFTTEEGFDKKNGETRTNTENDKYFRKDNVLLLGALSSVFFVFVWWERRKKKDVVVIVD